MIACVLIIVWQSKILRGSIGWSKALVNVGVLSAEEQQQLEVALNELLIEVRSNPQAILQDDAEDIHSWVESKTYR